MKPVFDQSIQRSIPVSPGVYSWRNSVDQMPKLFSIRSDSSAL